MWCRHDARLAVGNERAQLRFWDGSDLILREFPGLCPAEPSCQRLRLTLLKLLGMRKAARKSKIWHHEVRGKKLETVVGSHSADLRTRSGFASQLRCNFQALTLSSRALGIRERRSLCLAFAYAGFASRKF